MKYVFAAVMYAMVLTSPTVGQEQPEPAKSAGQRRGGPISRPEPPTAGRQMTLDVLIADLSEAVESPTAAKILELEKAGKLAAGTRLRLAMLDELPGFVQFGGRASRTSPAVASSSSGSRGGGFGTPGAMSPAPPNTGVMLQATTRIEDDGSIVMQIYLDRPEMAVPPKAIPADAGDEVRRSFAFMTQNTVRVKPGEPLLLSGRQSSAGTDRSQTWVIVTAALSEASAGKSKP